MAPPTPAAALRRLSATASRLRTALGDSTSTDAQWGLALLDLALRPTDPQAVAQAHATLLSVTDRHPDLAEAWNDLAVAQLTLGELTATPRLLFEALGSARRAAALDSLDPSARFTLGVALDRLGLGWEAETSWRRYLTLDEGSAWAREAEDRLRDWSEPSEPMPSRLREMILDSVLPAWGNRVLAGDSIGADGLLVRAVELAGALTTSGDSALTDALVTVRELAARGDHGPLAAGFVAAGRGAAAFRAAEFQAAAGPLEEAREALTGAPVPLWAWPAMLAGNVRMTNGQFRDADVLFAEIARVTSASGDQSSLARVRWAQALSAARQGRLREATQWYQAAAEQFAAQGDSTSWGSMLTQMAEIHSLHGLEGPTLTAYVDGISGFREHRAAPQLHSSLVSLGTYLADIGLGEAALAVLGENVEVARRTGRPKDLPEALIRLAGAAWARGDDDWARGAAAAARGALVPVSEPTMRLRLEADLARIEATLALHTDPARAHALLGPVITHFQERGPTLLLPSVLAQRARAALQAGDTAAAERDLADALGYLGARVADARARTLGSAVSAGSQDVYRLRIELQLARGDTLGALASAELMGGESAAVVGGVGQWGHADEAAVRYVVLPDRVLAWVVTSAGVRLASTAVVERDLETTAAAFVRLLERGGPAEADDLAAALYDRLITPIAPALVGHRVVTLVLDPVLQRVPFAALLDRGTGRRLVEEHALRHAGSLAMARAPRRASVLGVEGRGVLLVGDPAFDRTEFPGLAPLRSARVEHAQLAALYPQAHRLEGSAATREALLGRLAGQRVLHFAGHARSDPLAAERSHLVLSPGGSGGGGGLLTGAEIAGLDLRGVDLVVLSACGQAPGPAGAGGLSSLARAFGAAGARAVLSSAWAVDDAGTAALMVEFHRAVAEGVSAPEALQRAQVSAIRAEGGGERRGSAWAAFRYEAW
ncbi:MAG: CHAT domain-containing protein [Gemmatimonadales bacterium]